MIIINYKDFDSNKLVIKKRDSSITNRTIIRHKKKPIFLKSPKLLVPFEDKYSTDHICLSVLDGDIDKNILHFKNMIEIIENKLNEHYIDIKPPTKNNNSPSVNDNSRGNNLIKILKNDILKVKVGKDTEVYDKDNKLVKNNKFDNKSNYSINKNSFVMILIEITGYWTKDNKSSKDVDDKLLGGTAYNLHQIRIFDRNRFAGISLLDDTINIAGKQITVGISQNNKKPPPPPPLPPKFKSGGASSSHPPSGSMTDIKLKHVEVKKRKGNKVEKVDGQVIVPLKEILKARGNLKSIKS